VSTLEATRLLLVDMGAPLQVTEALQAYQVTHDASARRQLGPPRPKSRIYAEKGEVERHH